MYHIATFYAPRLYNVFFFLLYAFHVRHTKKHDPFVVGQNQDNLHFYDIHFARSSFFIGAVILIKRKRRRSDSVLTKTTITTENSKTNGQHKTPPKTSITQRLRTDLGRSVVVTTVIQLVFCTIIFLYRCSHTNKEKKKEIWLSPMTKTPITTANSKTNGQHKTPPKTSITQRLRTDLGRSVVVAIVIQLVWLNRFPTNHKSRVIKRTHI